MSVFCSAATQTPFSVRLLLGALSLALRQPQRRRRALDHVARKMVSVGKRADHLGPAPGLTPSRFWDKRQVGHASLPVCAALQSALAKCELLQTTLIMIAAECDRAGRYISTAIAEADFAK